MCDSTGRQGINGSSEPQCQFFVVRKKRLCRMTVKPGRKYCGEHEPQPKTADGEDDTRIPCPNDPKHTCYVSKLEKHLLICNARALPQPPYIVHNINAPTPTDVCVRKPLSQLSKETVMQVIEKVNLLYETHIQGNITTEPEHPIHSSVLQEFSESDRAESSLRHLRQVSSLLWLAETEGLVADNTCYVELGAGKGHMSYYLCGAWCGAGRASGALLLDRASLRHKRDNARRAAALRLRADLAHVALQQVPAVQGSQHVVGLAKHLCGVATDYALRCITADGVLDKTRGVVLATCCHHRCDRSAYIANRPLQELGISGDEMNVMLGIVSWATCGDGRSRERRNREDNEQEHLEQTGDEEHNEQVTNEPRNGDPTSEPHTEQEVPRASAALSTEQRAEVGRRAKHLLDWGRVLHLRARGFDARLCYYVPSTVSLENVCIVAKKLS
ncbi:tRNA:m(4)X modification enzyme TRM13 homolog [Anticarsia gemmatalis]|uniref:tRNA:m(4)X modification enzyme TRM13 homolog n=1 Tax=Anticarsia gemmatalis TaxID=129554 RepID=UPI003F75F652